MDAALFAVSLLVFAVAIFAPPLVIASAMKKRRATTDEGQQRKA